MGLAQPRCSKVISGQLSCISYGDRGLKVPLGTKLSVLSILLLLVSPIPAPGQQSAAVAA